MSDEYMIRKSSHRGVARTYDPTVIKKICADGCRMKKAKQKTKTRTTNSVLAAGGSKSIFQMVEEFHFGMVHEQFR